MDSVSIIKEALVKSLNSVGLDVSLEDLFVSSTNNKEHGDFASNCALKYSKQLKNNPLNVAKMIVANIDKSLFEKIEIAGPGFINFFMKKDCFSAILKQIINEKDNFGMSEANGIKVNIEFVSANPTGTLHVGHARGAAIGDSLCRIFSFCGYDVTREYYINDAGSQIDNLAYSIIARYNELLNRPFQIPQDGYHGEEIISIAKNILENYGDKLLEQEDYLTFFKEIGIKYAMENIVKDLSDYRVHFDVFSSEKNIRANHAIEKELEYLKKYTYEQDGAVLLKTTDFLDDKDRVIVKKNGDYTYFLPDIVYHMNKLSRGFDKLIDILGADHHGYINRMKSALMMHGYSKDVLEIELNQMVRIMHEGQEIKCSKRTGNAYTLKELCLDAGVDAARYFFAMRAASTHLDFDLDLAKEQSTNNPVYYAQYASARLYSVIDKAKDIGFDIEGKGLVNDGEVSLLKHLSSFKEVCLNACYEKAPYKITNYIHQLAEYIHSFYSNSKILDKDNLEITKSRVALCIASRQVLKNALYLIGVDAIEHM